MKNWTKKSQQNIGEHILINDTSGFLLVFLIKYAWINISDKHMPVINF